MNRISTWYEWVLFSPALLPLIYVQGMMYPLMTPKTLMLRALGIITIALFAFLVANGRAFFWNRLRHWSAWIPAALLGVAYISSLFGVGFYHSFWSTFERGDGLLTLTVCVGYFYLLLLSAEASWLPRFFKIVAWVGSAAAVYLLLQWFSTSVADLPFIVAPNGRIGGTMGNAAFLAAYLGLSFFATLAAAPEYRGWWRRALYSGAVLQLLAIFLTATRGTILALGLVFVALLVYRAKSAEEKKCVGLGLAARSAHFFSSAGAARIALAAIIIIAGLFFAFRAELAKIPFAPVARLASISLSDPTVSSRLFLWQNLSREALQKPILGYGAEHIDVAFDHIYDPTQITEEWFDHSHNAYLDYAIQFGVFGALLYIALIALLIRMGGSLWKVGDRYGPHVLGAALVYAIQNFFVFDTAVTLWLLLALTAVVFAYRYAEEGDSLVAIVHPRPFIGTIISIALLLLIIPVALQPLRANLLAFEAYSYQIADIPRAVAATKQGIALGTYADLEFGYNAYFMYTEEQMNVLTGDTLRMAYGNAATVLASNFNRYSYDVRTAVYLAQVLAAAPPGVPVDQGLLSEALTRSITESPKRAQPWYILANLSISEANMHPAGSADRTAGYAAAKDILSKYIALVPTLSKPHYVLAQLEYASGDSAAAAAEAAKGKEYYVSDLETARRAAIYYENVYNLPDAAFFLRKILEFNPTDANARADLNQIESHTPTTR